MPQAGFRLRSPNGDWLLADQLVLGRSLECDIVLDDHLVSRRHAIVRFDGEHVIVEDLGSSNGTLVNGVRVHSTMRLGSGDRVMVGSHFFQLLGPGEGDLVPPPEGPPASSSDTFRVPTFPPGIDEEEAEGATEVGSVFALMLAAAERDLSSNRQKDAEASVGRLLLSVRAALMRDEVVERETLDKSADCSLKLAELTGRGRWVDRVFDIYAAAEQVPTGARLARIAAAHEASGGGNARTLRNYVARVRSRGTSLTERERVDLAEIEALGS